MSARGDALKARPAMTRYRVLERLAGQTLVEAKPRTGRNHQIRVHFAQIGHPLVGDEFYAAGGTIKPQGTEFPCGQRTYRHALHAAALEFAHPLTGAWLAFRSPPPGDFRA